MELLIIYFLFSSTTIVGLFGRVMGENGASIITVSNLLFAIICSIDLFVEVGLNGSLSLVKMFVWLDSGSLQVFFGFLFDSLTVVMLNVVLTISLLVHLYSIEYMSMDPHRIRFMCYLSLFTFFMLMLIVGDNMLQIFLGWEGVGLSSYLLINFWFTRLEANKSALKAIIVNRFGDFGLGFSIVVIYLVLKNLDIGNLFLISSYIKDYNVYFLFFNVSLTTLISFFLFLGAVGKSAQLGLHVWLPDAMEGPTPVSALIHAATMVTAGIYLIVRFSPLIEYSSTIKTCILLIGGLTAYFAGTIGIFQNDLKKIIAYSTCSQLGYMMYACGTSNYNVAMFHLFNHAFFKALLFLCAGAVIHALNEEQDIRKMGGLLKVLPFTYTCIGLGSLSLMGFPFMTGYYSKDVILELSFMTFGVEKRFLYILLMLATLCTAMYSFRLLTFCFYTEYRGTRKVLFAASEVGFIMKFCLFFLTLCSIFIGYVFKDLFIGIGTSFFNNSIYILDNNNILDVNSIEFIKSFYKLLPVLLSIFFGFLGVMMYDVLFNNVFVFLNKGIGRCFYIILNKKWLFDYMYNRYINNNCLELGYRETFKTMDRGLIEYIGPTGLVRCIRSLLKIIKIQNGFIYNYGYIFLIGVVVLLSVVFFDISEILLCIVYICFINLRSIKK